MRHIAVGALLICLLVPPGTAEQSRPQCGSLFPLSMPPKPGSCFVETPIGSFFFFFDAGNDFILVETFGDNDDQVKLRPNGRISAHQTAREARFIYCPDGVTGRQCLLSVTRPGPRAFVGSGRFSVNTDADIFYNYTCPSTVTGRGTVVDPQTGEERGLEIKLIRAPDRDGSCRAVHSEIRLLP